MMFSLRFLCSCTLNALLIWPPALALRSVDVAVGTEFKRIPPSQARLARTGQKKVFDYTMYAEVLKGPEDGIQKVEFFPDYFENTYMPESYVKKKGPSFETRHDCWGQSTALVKLTMKSGEIKNIYKKIRFVDENESKHRLVYKPYHILSERAFGVEMEVVATKPMRPGLVRDIIKESTGEECSVTGYNKETMQAWKVETDTSIETSSGEHGIEIVSPILCGEDGLARLRKVASALSAESDCIATPPSCGLHVHVDLSGIDFRGLQKICQSWVKYEDAIDLLIDPDRRSSRNEYCLNVRNNMRFDGLDDDEAIWLIERQTTVRGLVNLMNAHPGNRNRYFKLNLQNLVDRRNTIEFRGPEGCINPDDIVFWVRLLNPFVERSSSQTNEVGAFGPHRTPKEKLKKLFNRFLSKRTPYTFGRISAMKGLNKRSFQGIKRN